MSDEHLSTLALDRLLAEETAGLEDARAHLETCAACRERLEGLRRSRDAWRGTQDPQAFAQAVLARAEAPEAPPPGQVLRPRFGARTVGVAALFTAAAAAAALLLLPSEPPGVATKGGPSLTALKVEGDDSRPLSPSETLQAGDRVGFRVRCEARCAVYLFGRSPSGAPYPMLPVDAPFVAEAGEAALLPFTARLDDADEDERVVAFFCEAPVPEEALEQALEAGRAPEGCRARHVRLPRGDATRP